ncbi:MAG: cell division protein ZapA [Selenomonadaceae bacterium]|nr:cell division protein ZapA [Selenomonadaceae bacterium]
MSEKKGVKVAVEIYGDTYPLKTDNPEHLRELARIVDSHMRSVAHRMRILSGAKIGVLAAMEIADDYLKLKKDYDDLMQLLDDK